jgi:hypothetical protein
MFAGGARREASAMLLRALLLAACSLALAAPAASAGSEWSLVFTATGSWDIETVSSNSTWREKADFTWRTEMDGITFDDSGRLVAPGHGVSTPAGKAWFHNETVINGRTEVDDCPYGGAPATWPNYVPKLVADASIAGPDAKEVLVLRPFDWLGIEVPCPNRQSQWPETVSYPFASGYPDIQHPFGAYFTMPADALAQGKVIHLVQSFAPRANKQCLDAWHPVCSVTWSGEVTLTRKQYAPPAQKPGEEVAPLPPPIVEHHAPVKESAPAPVPAPPAASKAKLDRGARSVSTTVTCAAGCTGSIKAFAGGAAPRAVAAAARKALASRRFVAAAGQATTVSLKLPARARRAVRRAGGVRLVVAMTPAGGAPVTKTVTAKLR